LNKFRIWLYWFSFIFYFRLTCIFGNWMTIRFVGLCTFFYLRLSQTFYYRETLSFDRNCYFTTIHLRTLPIYHTFYTILNSLLILLSLNIYNSFIMTFIIKGIKNIWVCLKLLPEIHHIIILMIWLVIILILLFFINRLLYVLINVKNHRLSWSHNLISNCFFHQINFALSNNFH
jgi:hypothetical protein